MLCPPPHNCNGRLRTLEPKIKTDKNGEELNISDHNLIRSWYRIGRANGASWRKPSYETRIWFKKYIVIRKNGERLRTEN